jgi:hypothetical protein
MQKWFNNLLKSKNIFMFAICFVLFSSCGQNAPEYEGFNTNSSSNQSSNGVGNQNPNGTNIPFSKNSLESLGIYCENFQAGATNEACNAFVEYHNSSMLVNSKSGQRVSNMFTIKTSTFQNSDESLWIFDYTKVSEINQSNVRYTINVAASNENSLSLRCVTGESYYASQSDCSLSRENLASYWEINNQNNPVKSIDFRILQYQFYGNHHYDKNVIEMILMDNTKLIFQLNLNHLMNPLYYVKPNGEYKQKFQF